MRPEQFLPRTAGESEIADRKNVRCHIAGLGVPASIAKRIKLLDIAEIEPGLLLDPGAEADFQGAVRPGRKRSKGERVPIGRAGGSGMYHQDLRLAVAEADDCRVQAELDLSPGGALCGRHWL